MHVYRGSTPEGPRLRIGPVDCWEGLLGNTSTGIPDDKDLVIDAFSGTKYTYGEARLLAMRLAYGLRTHASLREGDTITIFSPNSTLYPIICMAAQCASIVVSLVNHTCTPSELAHLLKDSGATGLFTSADLLITATKAANTCGIDEKRIWSLPGINGKLPEGSRNPYTTLDAGKEWQHRSVKKEKLVSTPAYLPYSSGTTGLPKGVVVTHENVIAMSQQLHLLERFPTRETVCMGILPMFHIYALTCTMHHIIYEGATLVLLPRFDLAQFLDAISKYRCTWCCIAPPVALALAKHPLVAKADLSSMKEIISGAAPLSEELSNTVKKRLGFEFNQGYGMTETTSVASVNRPSKTRSGSVGPLVPYQEARIIDENGKDVDPGERGELWLRGPNIIRSYHNNPEATKETCTSEGWLKTGDVGYFDSDGFLYLIDRTKELIKYKGYQVPPAEIEALLLQCELIADAAVIGVYSKYGDTELPRAYVVLSPTGKEHPNAKVAIAQFVTERSAPHKRLRGGVYFLDVIPKSVSGKILRKDLRAMAAKEPQGRAKL